MVTGTFALTTVQAKFSSGEVDGACKRRVEFLILVINIRAFSEILKIILDMLDAHTHTFCYW